MEHDGAEGVAGVVGGDGEARGERDGLADGEVAGAGEAGVDVCGGVGAGLGARGRGGHDVVEQEAGEVAGRGSHVDRGRAGVELGEEREGGDVVEVEVGDEDGGERGEGGRRERGKVREAAGVVEAVVGADVEEEAVRADCEQEAAAADVLAGAEDAELHCLGRVGAGSDVGVGDVGVRRRRWRRLGTAARGGASCCGRRWER